MNREIKPEDVPQLMRDGKLEFGMELEFSNSVKFDPSYAMIIRSEFTGFSTKTDKPQFESKSHGLLAHARFPLTALRDGDPVVVWNYCGDPKRKRLFHSYGPTYKDPGSKKQRQDVLCYSGSIWEGGEKVTWCFHSLPTQKELSEAGYTEDQINEMITRWEV